MSRMRASRVSILRGIGILALGVALLRSASAQTNFVWLIGTNVVWDGVSRNWGDTGATNGWTNTQAIANAVPVAGGSNNYTLNFVNVGAGVATNNLGSFLLNRLLFANQNMTLYGGSLILVTNRGGSAPEVKQNSGASARTVAIHNHLILSNDTTFGGSVNSAGATLLLGGVVSGPGSITKTGINVLALTNGGNTLASVTVSDGTLRLGASSGFAGANVLGAATVTNHAQVVFTSSSGGNALYSNQFTGSGSLSFQGTSLTYLSGSNSFTGGAAIASGNARLAVGHDHALGSGALAFTASGAALSATGNAARTLANRLVFSNNATLGHGTDNGLLTLTGDADLANGIRRLTISSPVVLSGVLSNGGFNKLGSGTLTLSNPANQYALGTSNSAGVLILGADHVLGSGTLVMNGGILQSSDATTRTVTNALAFAANPLFGVAGSGDLRFTAPFVDLGATPCVILVSNSLTTLAGVLTNSASLIKAGPGVLALSGVNLFTGDAYLSNGTLSVANAANLGGEDSAIVFHGGALQTTGAVTNNAANTGAFLKTGDGELALFGGNVFGSLTARGGNVRIAGGSVQSLGSVAIGNAAQTNAVLVVDGGAFAYSSNGTFVVGSGAGATGTVIVAEGGALYLTNRLGSSNTAYTSLGDGAGAFGSLIVSGGLVRTERTGGNSGFAVGGRWSATPGSGQLLMYGGSVDLNEALYVGGFAGSTGYVLVAGGTLTATNTAKLPTLDYVRIGGAATGVGVLIVSNQGVFAADQINVAFSAGSTGLLVVTEGGLVELTRNNYLKSSAGFHTFSNVAGGTLRFTTNAPDIALTVGNSHVIDSVLEFKGVDAANLSTVAGKFTFQGANTLRLNSATNAAAAWVFTNSGAFQTLDLAGANPRWQGSLLLIGNGGTLRVSNATATVGAVLTNAGTIRAIHANVTYGGPVVMSGLYHSDPSTNTFTSNLTVTASGALQGSNGDRFVFRQNLLMGSTNRSQFDLSTAAMRFADAGGGPTNHVLDLSGSGARDLGSNWMNVAQLATNFSLGRLELALGNRLQITGGVGNAFYVGALDLGGLGTNVLASVLDLDVNLYYDPMAIENADLSGLTYNSPEWHGALVPLGIPIPEPSPLLIAGAGLTLLIFLRREKRR